MSTGGESWRGRGSDDTEDRSYVGVTKLREAKGRPGRTGRGLVGYLLGIVDWVGQQVADAPRDSAHLLTRKPLPRATQVAADATEGRLTAAAPDIERRSSDVVRQYEQKRAENVLAGRVSPDLAVARVADVMGVAAAVYGLKPEIGRLPNGVPCFVIAPGMLTLQEDVRVRETIEVSDDSVGEANSTEPLSGGTGTTRPRKKLTNSPSPEPDADDEGVSVDAGSPIADAEPPTTS